ncbi:FimV/HubP family polar landmark protein [Billgrantia kenyensis]|uniref:Tetratricopeptide repeat protein n=1 Tax=Billgrantia kenyensis TaxID=321266 RepID=A0A7W0AF38_9GAMM|nr:FimV/HubP family polar landmark protein [Halomonas kenyensis]MBA2780220.1 tetratricopeptide repeat protein [Halomonas kenyensis]MCG6663124.1 tetratricopeptide repeat protein [Halomonas kenyensis]
MRRKLTLAVLLSLSAASPQALALGVGEVDVRSSLNAPLRAVIPLTDTAGLDPELLRVSVADPREFESAGLVRTPLAASVRADVEVRQGEWAVTLVSERSVREPWMDLLLRFDWPSGRQLREVTLLLDPPDYDQMPVLVSGPSRQLSPADTPTATQPDSTPQTVSRPSAASASQPRADDPAWVGSGDTLWAVAGRLRPDSGISMEQMMVALIEANPDVFPSGNINAMRAGHTLVVPSRDAIDARSGQEASRVVQAMNQAWANRGGGAPARVPLGPTVAAGQEVEVAAASVAAQASPPGADEQNGAMALDETPPPPDTTVPSGTAETEESTPRLTLLSDEELAAEATLEVVDQDSRAVAEGAAVDGGGGSLDPDVLATLGAGELAGGQGDSRLALLEQRWQESQAALEDVQAERDALQQELGGLRDEVEAMREQLAQLLAGGGGGDGPGGAVVQLDADDQADASWWGAMYPATVDRNLIFGAAGLAALLGLWLLVRRRQRRDQAESMGSAAMPSMVHGMSPAAGASPPGPSAATAPPMVAGMTVSEAESEERESVRPAMPQAEAISEADIFMAYGRYDQAREQLEAALDRDPGREDLRLKLLNVHVEQGSWQAAEDAMQKLAETGDPALMAEAARLMARRHAEPAAAASREAPPEAQGAPAGQHDAATDDLASDPAQSREPPEAEPPASSTPAAGSALPLASFATREPSAGSNTPSPAAEPSAEPHESGEQQSGSREGVAQEEQPHLPRDESDAEAHPTAQEQSGGEWDVIDYRPPALDPEPAPRVETPMQPSIDFPRVEPGRDDSAHGDDELKTEGEVELPPLDKHIAHEDDEWEVEEVAFPPLDGDNGPARSEPAPQDDLAEARRLLERGDLAQAHALLQRLLDEAEEPHLRDEARELITHYRL